MKQLCSSIDWPELESDLVREACRLTNYQSRKVAFRLIDNLHDMARQLSQLEVEERRTGQHQKVAEALEMINEEIKVVDNLIFLEIIGQ